MLPGRIKESGLTCFGVGVNGYADNIEAFIPSLNNCLGTIAEARDGVKPQQAFPAVCSEATGGVGQLNTSCFTNHCTSHALEEFFGRREVLDLVRLTISDHDVRLALQNRLYQVVNAPLRILIIAIGV